MCIDPMLWFFPMREGHFADVETEPQEVSDLVKVMQPGRVEHPTPKAEPFPLHCGAASKAQFMDGGGNLPREAPDDFHTERMTVWIMEVPSARKHTVSPAPCLAH